MKRELFVVAGAIVKDGKVFAAQRGNHGKTAYKWEFPGGKIDPGETPEQALAREFKEELLIDVQVDELVNVTVDEYEDVIINLSTYKCTLLSGEPVLTEHIAKQWSSKEELDKLTFAEADTPTLAKIKERYL
ncbi:MAG: (deoxy)nucleoside triphosphate pyrophosphohydrolase [Bacilli bacterium]|nr:(deoxy)nucleoside triphosphate pyrophosphohydrolase [Bacilli bacterium]